MSINKTPEWSSCPLQDYAINIAEEHLWLFRYTTTKAWCRIQNAIMQKVLENMPEE